jgi:hypothetical protein
MDMGRLEATVKRLSENFEIEIVVSDRNPFVIIIIELQSIILYIYLGREAKNTENCCVKFGKSVGLANSPVGELAKFTVGPKFAQKKNFPSIFRPVLAATTQVNLLCEIFARPPPKNPKNRATGPKSKFLAEPM